MYVISKLIMFFRSIRSLRRFPYKLTSLASVAIASTSDDTSQVYGDIYDSSPRVTSIADRYNPKFTRDPSGELKISRLIITRPKPFKSDVRLPTDRKSIVDDLLQNGFTVVRILTESEALSYQREFINFANIHEIQFNSVGLTGGTTHSQFQWEIRVKCKQAFATLYNTSNLMSSFDGGCFLLPNGKPTFEEWFHVDQQRNETYDNYRFQSVQGLVNLGDDPNGESGLIVIKDFHKQYSQYLSDNPRVGYGSFRINIRFDNNKLVCPVVPIGCLLIWDSKLAHCNMPHQSLNRCCVYVSMQPRHLAMEAEKKTHRQLFLQGRTSGHLAYGPGATLDNDQVTKTVKITDDVLSLVGS